MAGVRLRLAWGWTRQRQLLSKQVQLAMSGIQPSLRTKQNSSALLDKVMIRPQPAHTTPLASCPLLVST